MKHAVIEHSYLRPFERVAPPAARRPRFRPAVRPKSHSAAATRFAEICAGIGGTTMLHDLMPDVVTVSFGSRTSEISRRLHARGWDFVGTGA